MSAIERRTCCQGTGEVFKKGSQAAAAIKNDATACNHAVQLTAMGIELYRATSHRPTSLLKASKVLDHTETFIDGVQIVGSAFYWCGGGFKEDRKQPLKLTGMVSFTIADVCSFILMLAKFGVRFLAKFAKTVGLKFIAIGTAGIGYALTGINSFILIFKSANWKTVFSRVLHVLASGAHVAFYILMVAAPGASILVLALGITAKSLSLGSFAFATIFKKDIKDKKKIEADDAGKSTGQKQSTLGKRKEPEANTKAANAQGAIAAKQLNDEELVLDRWRRSRLLISPISPATAVTA